MNKNPNTYRIYVTLPKELWDKVKTKYSHLGSSDSEIIRGLIIKFIPLE